jgi:hypothetical protein
MEETNKTLALLLVAAIVVSLGGTIVSLNKMGEIEISKGITGKATGTGDVDINISDRTSITVNQNAINFGNGWVDNACNNCTMDTNGTSGTVSDTNCCKGEWGASSGAAVDWRDGFWIENDGNTNLSVNLTSDASATTLIGGNSPAPQFQWAITAGSSATNCQNATRCANVETVAESAASCGGAWSLNDWEDINTSETNVCSGNGNNVFEPTGTKNEFLLDFKVRVPKNAPPTSGSSATATITVEGTSI